jgi:hydroxyethylthiazole kinase-like uncharacterized protein yjeF
MLDALCLPALRKQQHVVKAFRIFAEKCKNKSLSVAPGTYIHQAYICAKESQNVTQIERHTSEFKITPDHLNILNKSGERHKYDYGHAVIVSGPQGQGGAARLAARGALRIGAGVVSVFTSRDAQAEHAAHLNAVMVKTYTDETNFADQLRALAPTAICIGPNLGLDDASQSKLIAVLSLKVPLCLDADAIKPVASAQIVMTPHEGELRRLIPDAFNQTTCRITLAKIAAKTMGCVVLFKGSDTLVARPNGDCTVVKSKPFKHAAWLATAGCGDVLSGMITGLMARGFDAFDAAALSTKIHLECAEIIGPGLIAEDIPKAIPSVLKHYLGVKTVST